MAHPPDIWSRNFAALERWNPAAAAMLAAAPLSEAWQAVTGRDGSPTFAQVTADGSGIVWLGGTSMPRETAAAMTASLEPGAVNGLGAGIGTGHEWRALVGRLHASQMLFVLESDPILVKLALTATDLADLLNAGRLVLLVASDAETAGKQLQACLDAHPGLEAPSVIHPLASLTAAQRHTLVSMGEQMLRQAMTRRAVQAAELAAQLAAAPASPAGLLALLVQGVSWPQRVLGEVVEALESRVPELPRLAVDHYASGSVIARLQALLKHRPRVIVSDLFRPQLGVTPPASMAIWTFVPPRPPAAYWQPERLASPGSLASGDRIVCHAAAHRRRLIQAGFPEGQVLLLPLGTTAASSGAVVDAERQRVALLADLPSLEPATYGLNLPSHLDLWQAAMDLIADDPFRVHPEMAADLFRRAQRRAGVAVEDPLLAASFERGVRDILLAAAPYVVLAEQLVAAGVPIQLVGGGWDGLPPGSDAVLREPLARRGAWNADVWNDVAVALHVSPDGSIHPGLLTAPRHGVALAALAHPWDGQPGTLTHILRAGVDVAMTSPGQLVATLRTLLRDAARRKSLADSAAARLQETATWARRVELLGAELGLTG